jgi:hypothetical protein
MFRIILRPSERLFAHGITHHRSIRVSMNTPSGSLHGVRDGAIVGTNDSDLTHLFTLQPEAALLSTALPHKLDGAEKEAAKRQEGDNVRNDVFGGGRNTEEIKRGEGPDPACFHPLLVAGDGSVLVE